MHIFSIANVLEELGVNCAVCLPNSVETVFDHGVPRFEILPYARATETFRFRDGKGPDLIHAWTPREMVRKLTERLASIHACPYLVHLEDNEEIILKTECPGYSYAELERLPPGMLDSLVPEHRSHPVHYRSFLRNAAGVTALMDRLLEFKHKDQPGLLFWPGFDEEFRNLADLPGIAAWRRTTEFVVVYTGNTHETNAPEVRALFLAVQALLRRGASIQLLKTGWNYVEDRSWIQDGVDSGAVIDLGFVPRREVPALLSAASILVQPGCANQFNDYRFPSKLPEFLVSGKPVILPRSNIGRFLRDGMDAVLLEEGNAIELAGKIEKLLADTRLAARLSRNGREFALRKLEWRNNVPPIKDFYEQILKSTRPTRSTATEGASLNTAAANGDPRLIAFYLPQFHPIPENDDNWGKGFTEWTNVTQARPNFVGHYQPQLPADLGFYDLRVPEVMEQQAALAREYGVYGFCHHYYWFNGRRVLERPLEQMLRSDKPDFPFCLCWANENWTRNWDGSTDDLLIAQDYSGDAASRFIRDVIPYFKDPRYIKVDGAPMLLVYRVDQLPDPFRASELWRKICMDAGIGRIHLCAVQSFGITDPRPYGFDAAVEFPPHTSRALIDPDSFPGISSDFEGYLEDYREIVAGQLARPWPEYRWYRGVMPAWDNTARRGTRAHILVHSSPELYEHWLHTLAGQVRDRASDQAPILFVNAWNEWAEGAYLEPDRKLGRARLEATQRALNSISARGEVTRKLPHEVVSGNGAVIGNSPACCVEATWSPTVQRYRSYPTEPLSYGTVRDFCDSIEHLNELATLNGDLKDLQRPWVLKAILARVPRPGRILEIGGGEPFVADLLSRMGYEAWIVDPYDGSGNGPQQYELFLSQYPHLHFVRSRFHDRIESVPDKAFDCIFSISVLEHIDPPGLDDVFRGMRRTLKPSGISIHAVNHVHRGRGSVEHLTNLRFMAARFGFSRESLESLLARLTEDSDTYYLSAEGHNRWRGATPYEDFPMRVCPSIHFISDAAQIEAAWGSKLPASLQRSR